MEIMASIFDAKDREDFSNRVSKIVKSCGFESYMIALQRAGLGGQPMLDVTTSYPGEWIRIYTERHYALKDPSVHHCQATTDPYIWCDDAFASAGAHMLLEEAQSFGVSHGISLAVHDRDGSKSMLSLTRDQSFQDDPRELECILALSKILSCSMHVMANRLIAPETDDANSPSLSRQETQCLQWFANGKTPWEIGDIMNISEATALFYLENAMEKLRVANRFQALAVALHKGIVD